jgi:hypothetical protein
VAQGKASGLFSASSSVAAASSTSLRYLIGMHVDSDELRAQLAFMAAA